ASKQRANASGEAEDRGARQGMQAAVAQDEGGAGRLGGEEPIAQTNFVAQRYCGRLLHKQGVGAGVDHKLAHVLSLYDSAGPVSLLEHHHAGLARTQLVGRRQPRDAGANDENVNRFVRHHRGLSRARATSAASALMNVRDVLSDSVRRSATPAARAVSAACTSMSKRISVWSHTKPIGTTRNFFTPAPARARISSDRSGPSQGSGVRPAL